LKELFPKLSIFHLFCEILAFACHNHSWYICKECLPLEYKVLAETRDGYYQKEGKKKEQEIEISEICQDMDN